MTDLAEHISHLLEAANVNLPILKEDSKRNIWFTAEPDSDLLTVGVSVTLDHSIASSPSITPFAEVHSFPPKVVGLSPFQKCDSFSHIEYLATKDLVEESLDLNDSNWPSELGRRLKFANKAFNNFRKQILADLRARYALIHIINETPVNKESLGKLTSEYTTERILNELAEAEKRAEWKAWVAHSKSNLYGK